MDRAVDRAIHMRVESPLDGGGVSLAAEADTKSI